MFLGVSGSVLLVEMNETERENFGAWLRGIQRRDYGNSAKAAYTAAKVTSTTWSRATKGLTIKDTTVTQLVNAFRPDVEGDWTRLGLNESVGAPKQDRPDYVSGPGEKVEGGKSEDSVLNAIADMRRDMQAMEDRIAERIDSRVGELDERLSSRMDRLDGPGA